MVAARVIREEWKWNEVVVLITCPSLNKAGGKVAQQISYLSRFCNIQFFKSHEYFHMINSVNRRV